VNCQAGGRSANATTVMKSLGLDATNLEGGINAWVGDGLPTVK
jgi:rhodanese-related sulfurtransferase